MEKKTLKSPWELFGIEHHKGWASIIAPLFDYIQNYNEGKPENEKIVIKQVKEKFGGLCFYVDNSTPELDKMIEEAETKSYNTCEVCGATKNVGRLIINGWFYTRCQSCAQKEVNRLQIKGEFTVDIKPEKQ